MEVNYYFERRQPIKFAVYVRLCRSALRLRRCYHATDCQPTTLFKFRRGRLPSISTCLLSPSLPLSLSRLSLPQL